MLCLCLSLGHLNSVPNDDTISQKMASWKINGTNKSKLLDVLHFYTSTAFIKLYIGLCLCLADCVIKSVQNPRHLMKMSSTFGAWMMDTAAHDDEKIWVAEHFSGTEERTNTALKPCI